VAALAPLADRLKVAFVFGSVARGGEHADSDVDVAVIGEVDFAEVTKALYPTQEVLHREVNPKIFSVVEWQSRIAGKSNFVGEILAKPKLFIVGTEHELDLLGQPGEEQKP
jgi:predicted nucleotidyltransferase